MNKLILMPLVCALWVGVVNSADAQVLHTTYYQPMTVYSAPAPVAVTAFQNPTPVTTYYSPAPVVAYSPAPVVAYRPTTVVASQPVVSWQPTAVTETRHRPILGGTVSRVRYHNMPVVVNSPVMVTY